MVPNLTPNFSVVLYTISDAKGSLGSILMALSFYVVNPYVSVPHIVSILLLFHPILYICLPCHCSLSPSKILHDTTISWSPALLVASLIPYTAPISDKSWYIGVLCFGCRGRKSPHPPGLPLTQPLPMVDTTTPPSALRFSCIPASRRATLWWKPPRVLRRIITPPALPPCIWFRRSWHPPPHGPIYLTSVKTSKLPSSDLQKPPEKHCTMQGLYSVKPMMPIKAMSELIQ